MCLENIRSYLKGLLQKDDLYDRQMAGFKKVREVLGLGEQTPSENAADIVLQLCEKRNR